jgi:hypothetical protein
MNQLVTGFSDHWPLTTGHYRAVLIAAVIVGVISLAHAQSPAAGAQSKLRHIQQNALRHPPDQTPTVLTEREINDYLASGQVQLPTGVRSARFTGRNGVVNATARVDFDAITAAARSSNPLLSLFTGVHDVHALAHASGSGGRGRVHIDSLDIDGITVPRMALEFFLNHYIRPKYPQVGMDSVFTLPERIDTARVGDHQLILTQK